jgi:hypothetical protein
MLFTISFSKGFFKENEEFIRNYFHDNVSEDYIIKELKELNDEVLVQAKGTVELLMSTLNYYMFDEEIKAIGSLIVTLPEEYYKEMNEWGYLVKKVKNGYNLIKEVENNLIYLVLDLSQFSDYEKVMELVDYYYNNYYDSDNDEDEGGSDDMDVDVDIPEDLQPVD